MTCHLPLSLLLPPPSFIHTRSPSIFPCRKSDCHRARAPFVSIFAVGVSPLPQTSHIIFLRSLPFSYCMLFVPKSHPNRLPLSDRALGHHDGIPARLHPEQHALCIRDLEKASTYIRHFKTKSYRLQAYERLGGYHRCSQALGLVVVSSDPTSRRMSHCLTHHVVSAIVAAAAECFRWRVAYIV